MHKRGKIVLIGAPPGSGKSAVRPLLVAKLKSSSPETWLVLEHEDVFSPQMRVEGARLSGLALNSREFMLGFNLPGQMAFQALLRTVADQGINAVGFAPFENVYQMVGEKSLFHKMKQDDFLGYEFSLGYFLVTGESAEETVQTRLKGRAGKSPWQSALDQDKIGVDGYYAKRSEMVKRSSTEFGLNLVEVGVHQSPDWLADKLVEMCLGPAC